MKENQNDMTTISTNDLNENNFIFTNFVVGLKEIPYNTIVLLVNNLPNNSVDLVYTINNNNQTKNLPFHSIKNISYTSKIKMSNSSKKVKENETKSMLLSAVVFGGNPLMQMIGNSGFNSLFDSISNNYDKVKFNVEYQITIQLLINNEEKKLMFISEKNPEIFIKQILDK